MTKKSKVKRSKFELVFDNEQRHEFLTGFSKRKQARKKAARDQLEKKYKEEVARIKKQKREQVKQRLEEVASVKNLRGIDLAKLAQNELDKEEVIDLPQHVVTITSTEEIDLTSNKEEAFLGSNTLDDVEIVDNSNTIYAEEESNAKEDKSAKSSISSIQKSKAKAADLARRTQMLKSKRHKRNLASTGKISKSQKKFLRKRKGGKQKNK